MLVCVASHFIEVVLTRIRNDSEIHSHSSRRNLESIKAATTNVHSHKLLRKESLVRQTSNNVHTLQYL